MVIPNIIQLSRAEEVPPFPDGQIIDSTQLDPFPAVKYHVRGYHSQKWKNILLQPGKDPNLIPRVIPGQEDKAEIPVYEPGTEERKKRGFQEGIFELNNRSKDTRSPEPLDMI
ncbi:hypothetical protein GE061_015648 [Apolygus lucorum]|uniref:Uncharacterized protein n=1 Tax=Apolygus lucorum TaxID=248454 RepID=A0A6A4JI97_APOLU|nr:hypothetical protein GE061_015648 [Apolygus lucorum]